MAGFRKAKAEQAALKMGIFGPAGSGKSFTSLLITEGLVKPTGKRIAYWDTEHGTDFYAQHVPNRRFHPEAFDFDAIYTRSITEGLKDLLALSFETHGAVVIDSMTHIWEATLNAYSGPKNRDGKIPFHMWGKIKKPYKDLMHWMLNSPFHVLILGREGNEWGVDDETGESVAKGVKMKAEGETAYEPHLLVRMEGVKQLREDGKSVKKNAEAVPTMFIIKDRTGVLQGQQIEYPNFETVAKPLVGLLGGKQAQIQSDDDASAIDGEAMRKAAAERAAESGELKKTYLARFDLAKTKEEVEGIAKELTPEVKKKFLPADLDAVREGYKSAAAGQATPRTGDANKADVDVPA